MAKLNYDASSLLAAITGEGNSVVFTEEEVCESRARYAAACEKSEIEERIRRAQAIEKSSRIYLTF